MLKKVDLSGLCYVLLINFSCNTTLKLWFDMISIKETFLIPSYSSLTWESRRFYIVEIKIKNFASFLFLFQWFCQIVHYISICLTSWYIEMLQADNLVVQLFMHSCKRFVYLLIGDIIYSTKLYFIILKESLYRFGHISAQVFSTKYLFITRWTSEFAITFYSYGGLWMVSVLNLD